MAFDNTLPLAIDIVFYALVVWAAASDVAKFRIPNAIVAAFPVLFVIAVLADGRDISWVSHLGAGGIVLVCTAILFYFNLFGGGDAKLLASLAIWVGMERLTPFLITVALLGGVLALIFLCVRPILARFELVRLPPCLRPDQPLPYGVAISGGVIIVRMMFPGI